MIRKIIHIDQEKCNGCGACANACHEGAIGMVNGKAQLLREDYCDGLGDCLPACPVDAIHFVEREAKAYDEAAVLASKKQFAAAPGCPGQRMRQLNITPPSPKGPASPSQLRQWPCQIRLVPVTAPFFAGADLLLAADCSAYAYGSMHQDFMAGRVTLIGCPKLDPVDYSEKLGEILRRNEIRSLLLVRMEVPCCGGLELAAKRALQNSGKNIPFQVTILSLDGKILDTH